jgi:hypothetical protein
VVHPSAVIGANGERTSFKDIRKILSSPSVSSSSRSYTSSSEQTMQTSSVSSPPGATGGGGGHVVIVGSMEHIYEEIPEKKSSESPSSARPLPPLPRMPMSVKTSIVIDPSSDSSPVKSIFEGATKYDILHYLEDARDRGLTDVELDMEEDEDEEEEEEEEDADEIVEDEDPVVSAHHRHRLEILRNQSHRVSSCSSSGGSSTDPPPLIVRNPRNYNGSSQVDIERNDSGLGSETGNKAVVVVKQRAKTIAEATTPAIAVEATKPIVAAAAESICQDCDQTITDIPAAGLDW